MDLNASRGMARLSLGTAGAYLLGLVVFLLLGLRDPVYLPIWGATSAAMLVIAFVGCRYPQRPFALIFVTLLIFMLGLVARMFTPILVAPPLCTIVLATLPFNPVISGRRTVVAITVGTLVATLGVWVVELLGLIAPTVIWTNGTFVLRSPVDGIGTIPAVPFLFIVTGITLIMASGVGYFAMRAMQHSRKRLALQAWHLRQLV